MVKTTRLEIRIELRTKRMITRIPHNGNDNDKGKKKNKKNKIIQGEECNKTDQVKKWER